jgi:hypothetical protein
MMSLIFALLLAGYGFGYDGQEGREIYFHISTPTADYGIVVSEKEIYCDAIAEKL